MLHFASSSLNVQTLVTFVFTNFIPFEYLQSYQLLCERYPKFRERSENVDLVVEISLQPWKVFKPDGVSCRL